MNLPSPPRRTPIPLSAWLLGLPGLACMAGAVLLWLAPPASSPLLAEPGAALAVSGVALIGSAGFPLVLARLAARDQTAG